MSVTSIFGRRTRSSPKNLLRLAGKYLEWMRVKNYSPKTIYAHKWYLGFFLTWCDERGVEGPPDVTREVVERYEAHLLHIYSTRLKGRLTTMSHIRYQRSVHLFFNWLAKENHVLYNPMTKVHQPRPPKTLPGQVLTATEAESIIALPDVSDPYGIRDRAILETLYSTGIRRAELIALTIRDIDYRRGTLFVAEGKGKKDRVVPIGERALAWLEKYVKEVRPMLTRDPHQTTLFLTKRKGAIANCDTLTMMVRRYVKPAGCRGACHIFRRSMATLMLENGADVRYVQEILGHSSLNTTQLYTKVTIPKLKEVHRRTHPAQAQDMPEICGELRHHHYRCPRYESQSAIRQFWCGEGEFIALGNKYFAWMRTQGYAERTVEGEIYNLKLFVEWCREREITRVNDLTRSVIERYQSHLARLPSKKTGEPITPQSRKSRLLTVSSFSRWLAENNYVLYSPAVQIELPKVSKRLPRQTLTAQEVEKVMAVPDLATPAGIRDRAILETFYSTGMRRRELARLKVAQIAFERGTVLIHGKGQKDRVIPIGESARNWVEAYLNEVRPLLLPHQDEETLFLNKYGLPFNESKLGDVVSRYIKDAGIGKTGSCHLLRHTMATLMLENGADVRYIQEILGHSELSTTERYTKVSIARLKEVHTRTHPAQVRPPHLSPTELPDEI